MIRQNIIVGNYVYITDLYKAKIDLSDDLYKNFVMLRQYEVINDVIQDKNIYIIERNVLGDVLKNMQEKNTNTTTKIAYPISNVNYVAFSDLYAKFCDDYSEYTFSVEFDEDDKTKIKSFGDDIYELYEENTNKTEENPDDYILANILCDKLRIYHPATNPYIDALIYIDSYFNDIHFHLYCAPYSGCDYGVDTEFKINNNTYSEYIEITIPNIEYLFEANNIYFIDDMNINASTNESILTIISEENYNSKYVQYVPLKGLTLPYEIKTVTEEVNTDTSKESTPLSANYNINAKHHTVTVKLKTGETHGSVMDSSISAAEGTNYYSTIRTTPSTGYKLSTAEADDSSKCKLKINGNNIIVSNVTDDVTVTVSFTVSTSETITYNEKLIYGINRKLNSSVLTNPIAVTIYPFSSIDTQIHQYISNDDLPVNSDTFNFDINFGLSSKVGFNNGIISIINTIQYPYYKLTKFDNAAEAYINYYNIKSADSYVSFPYKEITYDEACYLVQQDIPIYAKYSDGKFYETEITSISNNAIVYSISIGEESYICTNADYKLYQNLLYDEDIEDNELLDNNIKSRGFHIVIATDTEYKNIIYELNLTPDFLKKDGSVFNVETDDIEDIDLTSIIDDYAFQLNNIFSDWVQLPELILIKVAFIDKITHILLLGNDVIITKEQFKYFINETSPLYRLDSLVSKQNQIEYIKDMNTSYFNFIDKFNCTIVKENTETNNTITANSLPKVLYKPIFYRTQELQAIRIKNGIQQNIGINLASYMSKVETFKLIIGSQTFVEYGRNDIYVIFKITASLLSDTSGYYNILDQDNEYISDGTYTIY